MFSGRQWNPPNRFHPIEIDWEEPPPRARLEILEDHTRGVLSRNDNPDLGFTWGVNPYRGCTHACAYCYARAFHEYLGLGAGTDFERRITVKLEAARLLREAFDRRSWRGEVVAFSGVTDCYQPLERRYRLTRACLEVCAAYHNPVSIVTRSPLITRDLDILMALAEHRAVSVSVSIPIVDPATCRVLEPGTASPQVRLRAVSALAAAGIPVGVSLAPVIPGLTDSMIPDALEAARHAGATWAWMAVLRVQGSVARVFEARLRQALPDRADAILARLGRGKNESLAATSALFDLWWRRLGFESMPSPPDPSPFRRPGQGHQLRLL